MFHKPYLQKSCLEPLDTRHSSKRTHAHLKRFNCSGVSSHTGRIASLRQTHQRPGDLPLDLQSVVYAPWADTILEKENRNQRVELPTCIKQAPKAHFGKAKASGHHFGKELRQLGRQVRRLLEPGTGGKGPKGESQIGFLRVF